MRRGQKVQHRIGGSSHGDIQRHRIFKRLEGGDVARQYRSIILFVIAFCQLDHKTPCLQKKFFAVRMGRQQRPVSRQTQPQCLGQAVH